MDDLISFQKQIFYTQPLGFNEKSGGCFYRVCYPKNINEGGSQENIVLALEEYDLSDKQCKARYGALRSTASSYKGELTGSDKHLSFFLEGKPNAEHIHVFESAIDLLSFATLALLAAFYGLALPEGGNFGSKQRVAESAD